MWILPVDKYDTGEKESNPNCAEIGQGYVIGKHHRVDGRVGVAAIEHHTRREFTLREMGGLSKTWQGSDG